MNENLAIWSALYKTDPKHVKPITGKTYSGDSPRPHYIIFRLTEQFGPVGLGFGWSVLSDGYIEGQPYPDGGCEKLHEVRIRFWWRADGERCEVESYGCTKALYKAGTKGGSPGYWVSDEDAAKKSLTDAIVKAASWLGAAGDIFMGQWNDSKYQAELRAEMATPRPAQASVAPHDPETGDARDHGTSIRDAWEDGIRDSLPANATPRQFHEAAAARLREEFSAYKSKSGLDGAWAKYGKILARMNGVAPDLFLSLQAHYEACEKALAAKPVLTKAAGEAIIQGIAARDTLAELEAYMTALRRGPNAYAADHPKIKAAYDEHRAAIMEANPAENPAFAIPQG